MIAESNPVCDNKMAPPMTLITLKGMLNEWFLQRWANGEKYNKSVLLSWNPLLVVLNGNLKESTASGLQDKPVNLQLEAASFGILNGKAKV